MGSEGKVNDHGMDAIRKSTEQVPGASDPHIYRIRTCITNSGEDEGIPVEGTFADSAITETLQVTTLIVTSTASKIPATPLAGRNTLNIQNFSTTEIIYISTSASVTAGRTPGSTTDGMEIGPLEGWNYAINDTAEIYAICESGKTALIKTAETK